MSDSKDFEYRIRGAYEGSWRAIGYGDTPTLREAADILCDTLYELAEEIDSGRIRSGSVEKPGPTED